MGSTQGSSEAKNVNFPRYFIVPEKEQAPNGRLLYNRES